MRNPDGLEDGPTPEVNKNGSENVDPQDVPIQKDSIGACDTNLSLRTQTLGVSVLTGLWSWLGLCLFVQNEVTLCSMRTELLRPSARYRRNLGKSTLVHVLWVNFLSFFKSHNKEFRRNDAIF